MKIKKIRLRRAKILSFCAFFIMIFSLNGNAAVYGGYWSSNPTYYMNPSDPYAGYNTTGVNTWNTTLASINASIRINSNSLLGATVQCTTGDYGKTGWDGNGVPGPSLTSTPYTGGNIYYNLYYFNGTDGNGNKYTPAEYTAVCTHEWGHILGLAHTKDVTNKSLMCYLGVTIFYDLWGLTSPTSYDIQSLDSIY